MPIDFGLRWLRASLRGYGVDGPSSGNFFDLIAIEPDRSACAAPSNSAWQSANVELFAVDQTDLQDEVEPTEAFAGRVERGFLNASEWLDARPPGAFDRWRDRGGKADIFIGG